jgi:hypothetical protein
MKRRNEQKSALIEACKASASIVDHFENTSKHNPTSHYKEVGNCHRPLLFPHRRLWCDPLHLYTVE